MAEKTLKDVLVEKGLSAEAAAKFTVYVTNAKNDEVKLREKGKNTPVTNNGTEQLISLAVRFWNMGIVIDGVNAVITGKNMAMVTFHGYKNKVLQTYPETEFDYGLIREGDKFKVSKDSGKVIYSHEIADPFSSGKITGAYVVFKNKRGEYFEALSEKDYNAMKDASKQSYLWNTWDSEFWLKSVMKRACKRNFNDIVAEIDKNDNEDYGVADTETADQGELDKAFDQIAKAKDEDELTDIVTNLSADLQKAVTKVAADKFKELQGND